MRLNQNWKKHAGLQCAVWLKKTALAGGNALIGIDFDYVNFVGNLMGVIASGTAVKIEPNEVENEK